MNDVGEAKVLQRSGHEAHTGTVDRRVDDFHVVVTGNGLGAEREGLDAVEVTAVNLLADNLDEGGITLEFHIFHRSNLVHLVDGLLVVGGNHLGTVVPVGLVAVVLLGVVRGGEDYTTLATQFANGKRYLGRGTQGVEQIDLDTVGREDVGSHLGKTAAVVAAVVTDSHLYLRKIGKCLLQVVGQALRGGTHGVDVHAVGTGTHDAAQTARTKFEILVEGLDEVGLIFVVEHGPHSGFGLLVIAVAQPYLSFGNHLLQ